MVNLIFMGAPGAGKGTLSEELCWQEKLEHLSTGDLLRAEIKKGSELGQEVQSIVKSGGLVSDEIVAALVEGYMKEVGDSNGVVFDGFPRTIRQAELLDETMTRLGLTIDGVVLLEVVEDVLILRLTGRRICKTCGKIFHLAYAPPKEDGICDNCGTPTLYQRPDDNEVSVRERLEVYERDTKPLIDYYQERNQLVRIDASRDKASNMAMLREALEPILHKQG